jgi:hypothetical protein
LEGEEEMRIEVTLENILKYNLDVITGNSRADLLAAAARAEEAGEAMYVTIPDVMGGDTEAPEERNTFEHYADLPDPDGRKHVQQSIGAQGRTKMRLTQKSVDGLKAEVLDGGIPEEEWEYWLANAVEIVENPYDK